jgi:hypothetical protein
MAYFEGRQKNLLSQQTSGFVQRFLNIIGSPGNLAAISNPVVEGNAFIDPAINY